MEALFKTIGLVARHNSERAFASLKTLAAHLTESGYSVLVDRACAQGHDTESLTLIDRTDLGKVADLAIVIGGDGTMLSVARHLAPYRVPLAGVNRGRLGFMTDVPLAQMLSGMDAILAGEFVPEERMILQCTVFRGDTEIVRSLALNDVVFSRGSMGSMIEFEVFIDAQFVYSQRSDGLIITTPTGSTAYALAAGGPILHPTVPAIALVPICPQSLSNRPIAVNDSSNVEFILTKGVDARVHFDGHGHCELQELDRVLIQRYRNPLKLIHPLGYNYYDMLRHKLHWGERLI